MRTIIVIGLLVLGFSTGCNTVQDARGRSEICEVHHMVMQEMVVPAPRDNTPYPREYLQDGLRFFPHAMPDYAPSRHKKLVIYICDECVRAQTIWKIQHPGVVR